MLRAFDKWLMGYVKSVWRRPGATRGPRHILFCVCDHFEPFRPVGAEKIRPDREEAQAGIAAWTQDYIRRFKDIRDHDGRPPRHTFFYPEEDYEPGCLDRLAEFCRSGYGEVEVHLHHRNDTASGLQTKLEEFTKQLHGAHGLLGTDAHGAARYGFVHGNWALCNSRPDGDWCGVNEELSVLAGTGCYADFTFPSAPSPTQPRMVNSIYYAKDTPGKPRSHDYGRQVTRKVVDSLGMGKMEGRALSRPNAFLKDSQELMLIQGPLALDWKRRKWGIFPRLENGELSGVNPPGARRADLWIQQHVHVEGIPNWIFVKIYTHGYDPRNRGVVLGESMVNLHTHLQAKYNDGVCHVLHYVTAREMYNIIKAAEAGEAGDPGEFRDYEILPPPCGAET